MGEIREMNDDELNQVNGGIDLAHKASGKNPFCCQFCDKSFSTEKKLIQHIKSAHPKEPVVY